MSAAVYGGRASRRSRGPLVTGSTSETGVSRVDGAEPQKRRAGEIERVSIEGARYALRWQMCGKANCRSCPHGPYWYRVFRQGNREAYRYVGKDLVGYVNKGRVRAWLEASKAPELPGVPGIRLCLPADRPDWLPPEDWARLQAAYEEWGVGGPSGEAEKTTGEGSGEQREMFDEAPGEPEEADDEDRGEPEEADERVEVAEGLDHGSG